MIKLVVIQVCRFPVSPAAVQGLREETQPEDMNDTRMVMAMDDEGFRSVHCDQVEEAD